MVQNGWKISAFGGFPLCPNGREQRPKKIQRGAQRGIGQSKIKGALEALPHPVKLVYCSGTLMYGNHTSAVLEGTEERPIAYARAYERAERPWKEGSLKMDIRIAYPAWIFGPESWFEAFYLRPFKATGAVAQIGSGDAMMNLVHVRDVAGQLLHIALHGEPGERATYSAVKRFGRRFCRSRRFDLRW